MQTPFSALLARQTAKIEREELQSQYLAIMAGLLDACLSHDVITVQRLAGELIATETQILILDRESAS